MLDTFQQNMCPKQIVDFASWNEEVMLVKGVLEDVDLVSKSLQKWQILVQLALVCRWMQFWILCFLLMKSA